MKTVGVVITAGKINGGNAQFRRNKRYIRKRPLCSFKAFAGDILLVLKVKISALVEYSVVGTASVNFDD